MPAMLIGRYHAAINLQDWENLEDVFTTDAVWEVLAPVNLRFEGRDAHRTLQVRYMGDYTVPCEVFPLTS